MLRLGRLWMRHISQLLDRGVQRYGTLPKAARQSFLPVVLASLPLTLGSTMGAYWTLPLVIVLTVALLYFTTLETDRFMFDLSKTRAHIAITMPMCGFISLWGIVLALMERREAMLGIVGPYSLLLLVACAPAFRWKQARVMRRIPLHYSFSIVGSIVLIGSFSYV